MVVCLSATVGKGLCSFRRRSRSGTRLEYLEKWEEFAYSTMFISIWAVPNAASRTEGAEPLPYSGVCDKHQFAGILRQVNMCISDYFSSRK